MFCDLRGFTSFAKTAGPGEVTGALEEYHACLGYLIHKHEGPLAGDAVMVLFNDPLPCPAPSHRAVRMAVEMRDGVAALCQRRRKLGHQLGFGIGIAHSAASGSRIGSTIR